MRTEIIDVENFLKQWRTAIEKKRFLFIDREKNFSSIAEMSLSSEKVREELFKLTYKNYVKGPERDRDREGQEIWVFGLQLQLENEDCQIYIKIKVFEIKDVSYAKCISFHKASYPLSFPLT